MVAGVGRAPAVARRAVEVDGRRGFPVGTTLLEGAPGRDEGEVGELSTAEDAALIAPLACSAAPGAGGMRALVAEFDADDPGHAVTPSSASKSRTCARSLSIRS
jgi:hypothetical protein